MDFAAFTKQISSYPDDQDFAKHVSGSGQIFVWSIAFDPEAPEDPAFRQLLSPDELERAGRFQRPGDRSRYVVAHGSLRSILHSSFGIPFACQQFEHGALGKPSLPPCPGYPPLHFNLSHSAEFILIAISGANSIGVDIEAIREPVDHDVVATFCGSAERQWLNSLEDGQRLTAMYRLWTIKESMLKVSGEGLHADPREIVVDISGDVPRIECSQGSLLGISVRELSIDSRYAAAVAHLGAASCVKHMHVELRNDAPARRL